MQEIIYKIDNWTIIKLLGGIAVILIAVIGLVAKIFFTKITQAGQYHYDKKLEDIKGDINKNNSVLSSLIQNYFSSSQKILDKKIQAYDLLWTAILNLKDKFPSGISLVYQLLIDEEIEKPTAFKTLNENPKMGPSLRSYSIDEEQMLLPFKPYLSDNSYKLYYTYQGLLGRLTHQFIWNYQKSIIYDWKKDKNLESILRITLTDKEIEHIKGLKLGAFSVLTDLLEYKILQDIRSNLNIKYTTDDTIEYLKDIEKIFSATNK